MKKLRFIHCADLHIDIPFKGLENLPSSLFKEVKQSTFKALERLVQTAINKHVDFVLMVGDVFDQSTQSVYAQMQFLHACNQLSDHNISVYVSFGNHDYLQRDLIKMDFPPNVHLFPDEHVTHFVHKKNNKDIATIYGFSYMNPAVYENKTPLFNKKTTTPYHIGMLHGSVEQNTGHDTYAPFKIQELVNKDFDYWALGHIHKRQHVKEFPPIVYPGNIQGRSKKETGEKGCYYVELSKHHTELTFIPIQTVRFEQLTIDVSTLTTIQAIEGAIDQQIQEFTTQGKCFIWIYLEHFNQEIEHFYYEGMLTDMIDFINEKMMGVNHWFWIQSIDLKGHGLIDKEIYRNGDHFLAEILRLSPETDGVDTVLKPLWKHPQARKFLTSLTNEEKDNMLEEAENILLYQLTRKHNQ
ncbi:putative metallophosphoesterase YhaO [Paraliobacillus sp. PM-2]|uniref:metallophosphoesterase family protein n=1 Tax=Paraliobacillus sp. PM-2 TaxID=1462524 RepID=UPI00061B9347|nr:DNA repair exonuclease [Paraliobacillus sp. PM-2]CQR47052.1 putative metallophosphoesterase YhaO [Paraliobacillus sp. PM-2]